MSRTEYFREWRAKNKEKIKRNQKKYYEDNKERLKEGFRDYYKNNRETIRQRGKKHYEDNKALYLMYSRTRKATIKKRTPPWLSDEQFSEIKDVYLNCKSISESTEILHHVDHIVPLCGKNVCGLHVPWNLQILKAEDNLGKSNKHESDSCTSE
jgi:hypothetical protein